MWVHNISGTCSLRQTLTAEEINDIYFSVWRRLAQEIVSIIHSLLDEMVALRTICYNNRRLHLMNVWRRKSMKIIFFSMNLHSNKTELAFHNSRSWVGLNVPVWHYWTCNLQIYIDSKYRIMPYYEYFSIRIRGYCKESADAKSERLPKDRTSVTLKSIVECWRREETCHHIMKMIGKTCFPCLLDNV